MYKQVTEKDRWDCPCTSWNVLERLCLCGSKQAGLMQCRSECCSIFQSFDSQFRAWTFPSSSSSRCLEKVRIHNQKKKKKNSVPFKWESIQSVRARANTHTPTHPPLSLCSCVAVNSVISSMRGSSSQWSDSMQGHLYAPLLDRAADSPLECGENTNSPWLPGE